MKDELDDTIEPLLDQDFSDEEKALLVQKGLLLEQLLQSDKFVQFFNMNYDLMSDGDTKELFLVEVPDAEAAKRAAAIIKQQMGNQSVVAATIADMKKITGK